VCIIDLQQFFPSKLCISFSFRVFFRPPLAHCAPPPRVPGCRRARHGSAAARQASAEPARQRCVWAVATRARLVTTPAADGGDGKLGDREGAARQVEGAAVPSAAGVGWVPGGGGGKKGEPVPPRARRRTEPCLMEQPLQRRKNGATAAAALPTAAAAAAAAGGRAEMLRAWAAAGAAGPQRRNEPSRKSQRPRAEKRREHEAALDCIGQIIMAVMRKK